jgi:hypothetical protein
MDRDDMKHLEEDRPEETTPQVPASATPSAPAEAFLVVVPKDVV